jgi:hypothetical protein
MARNKNKVSLLPLALGIFLFILVLGVASVDRAARPSDDNDQSNFEISLSNTAPEAVIGEPYWVDVRVENTESSIGTMWLQCSILDGGTSSVWDWLQNVDTQSFSLVDEQNESYENCFDETYSQTGRVTLGSRETETHTLTFTTPDAEEPYIYCTVFERCCTDSTCSGGSGSTDGFRSSVTVVEATEDENDTETTDEDEDEDEDDVIVDMPERSCNLDSDCKGYFFGKIVCHDNLCMDAADVTCSPECAAGQTCNLGVCEKLSFSDINVKQWIDERRILVTLMAIILVVIGIFGLDRKKLLG